jgi:hypothetical protein
MVTNAEREGATVKMCGYTHIKRVALYHCLWVRYYITATAIQLWNFKLYQFVFKPAYVTTKTLNKFVHENFMTYTLFDFNIV